MNMNMNIYHCWRDFDGFGLSAVVQAETEESAINVLEWEIDDDTKEIKINKIGTSNSGATIVWSEESL